MSETIKAYDCPGIAMDQPEGAPEPGYVACYRAGHTCPPKESIRTEDDYGVTIRYRCPCCGDGGMTFMVPKEWEPEFDASRADQIARDWESQ